MCKLDEELKARDERIHQISREKYRQKDTSNYWAREARSSRDELEEELSNEESIFFSGPF